MNKMVLKKKKLQLVSAVMLHNASAISSVVMHVLRSRKKNFRGRLYRSRLPDIRSTNPRHGQEIYYGYTEKCFERLVRMTRNSFRILLAGIQQDICRNAEMGRRFGNHVILPEVRLGLTLRLLAGGTYQDVAAAHNIGFSTAYHIFHDTCTVLNKYLKLDALPDSTEELKKLAEGFKTFRSVASPLTGCIGALDGILIPIKKPEKQYHPASFFCRKKYYALPVQALVSHDYRFLCVSIKCVGSTHDALCHKVSELGKQLEEQGFPCGLWIVGDEAYICSEVLITPFPVSRANEDETNFNYFLSSLRIVVEQVFGVLVSKWRILKNTLQFQLYKNTRIVLLCMKLHNFLIKTDRVYSVFDYSDDDRNHVKTQSEDWYAFCEAERDTGGTEISCPQRCQKRSEMVHIVKKLGLKRPPVS